jgi:type II secretory pathway component PulF
MMLKETIQNMFVTSKKKRSSSKKKSFSKAITSAADRLAFNWKIRQDLYLHIAAQQSNSIPIETALENFRSRLIRNKKVTSDKIVSDIARKMRDGSTMANAMAAWIPQDELGIISSGELSGTLPKSLRVLIDAKRRITRVRSALKQAMINPLIYLIAIYGMLWVIGKLVSPSLQQILPKSSVSGLAYGLYEAGDLANSLWALLPPILFMIVIAIIIWSLPRWTGKHRITAEKYFPYSFYRDINGYTWLMTFASLLRAGMADNKILEKQIETATPWQDERFKAIWWRMENGSSLSKSLLAKGKNGMPAFGFPNPDIVDSISSLDGFSDFPEVVTELANQWAEDLEANTLAFAKSLGFWMEMLMYGAMALMMIAINSLSTQIGSVPGVS